MQKVLTAEEMREVDRLTTEKYGIPSILLMENAAHAAANVIKEKLGGEIAGKSFLILCGKGNNGGDGAALARILWQQNAEVFVIIVGKIEETKGDAKINFEFLGKLGKNDSEFIDYWEIETYEEFFKLTETFLLKYPIDMIVDAMFGTGLTRKLADHHKQIAYYSSHYILRSEKVFVTSLDLPSGLNSDSFDKIGTNIKADLTVTFTAPKLANVLPPASNFNGELFVANIGSPQELIDASPSKTFLYEKQDAQNWLEKTKFTSDSYKNKRGHALLIAGSKEYTGAAVLAANAAMLSGVGLTTVATSESAQMAIASKVLEEVITRRLPENENGTVSEKAFAEIEKIIERIDVIGIGCGIGDVGFGNSDFGLNDKNNIVRELITKRKMPVVIDADGLNALAPFELEGSDELPLILTPHEGEFLKLLGTKNKEILNDRVKVVRDFAEKHKVILVLKGERVLTAAPDGRVVINPTGNSGLGKAGNGDTLTGIITGFVAQAVQMKVDVFETVLAAVYISSLAGDIAAEKFGKRTMLASDVRNCLSEAFRRLENNE